jgi:signal transduction histidine kinase
VAIESGLTVDDLRIRAEGSEFQHALINLLLNAVQACPATGGAVRIDVMRSGGDGRRAEIRITDNGCGIAPENQSRIFEPFFSVRPDGTGLGLFLSLNFVRRSGGDILVQSTPGHGSTFSIVLPAVDAAARAGTAEAVQA